MKPVKKFRLVEVQCDSVNKFQFTFSDDRTLSKAKRIVGLETYRVGKVSVVVGTQRAVVNDTVFNKSFLTLKTADSTEVGFRIPFSDMERAGNNGMLYEVDMPPLQLSYCYIDVASIAALNNGESWLIGFVYEN